jgi:hypothetical protein
MFKTKGQSPEWQLLYDHCSTLPVDAVVTYDQLDQVLGRDFRDDRGPLAKTQTLMLENVNRTLVNVRGVGYRVARATEHMGLAKGQRRRAKRAMTKGIRIIQGTDRQALTAQDRQRLDALELNMLAQQNMLRRTEARVSAVEKATRRTDDRMDRLISELRRKGVDVDVPPAAE